MSVSVDIFVIIIVIASSRILVRYQMMTALAREMMIDDESLFPNELYILKHGMHLAYWSPDGWN